MIPFFSRSLHGRVAVGLFYLTILFSLLFKYWFWFYLLLIVNSWTNHICWNRYFPLVLVSLIRPHNLVDFKFVFSSDCFKITMTIVYQSHRHIHICIIFTDHFISKRSLSRNIFLSINSEDYWGNSVLIIVFSMKSSFLFNVIIRISISCHRVIPYLINTSMSYRGKKKKISKKLDISTFNITIQMYLLERSAFLKRDFKGHSYLLDEIKRRISIKPTQYQ